MPEVVNLNEKIRKLESEVTGHYKEQKESKEIELEMTKQVKELEYGKRDIEMALKATNEKLIQNQVIIRDRVMNKNMILYIDRGEFEDYGRGGNFEETK